MQKPIHLLFTLLLLASPLHALELKEGVSIDEANKAMAAAGYRETGLSMSRGNLDLNLVFWGVDDGVLIVSYSIKTKKIYDLTYYWSDGRAKAHRKTKRLIVTRFDIKTGAMLALTKQPEKPQPSPETK